MVCAGDTVNGLTWTDAVMGTTSKVNCPPGQTGRSKVKVAVT